MKFLYFTDSHIKAANPKARLDNFKQTILNKLRYIGHLASELDVDCLLCGGDLFDRPDNPDALVREVQLILSEINKPVYSVLGNHDIYGMNPQTFEKTSFGLLEGPGLVTRLSMEPIILNDEVSLTGCDAHFELDKNGRTSDYTDIPLNDHIKIHVVHGFLTDDDSKWEKIPHTCIDDILNTNADIILTGHEHSGFGIIKRNGKIFCNPGALARVSASVGDVNLTVKVLLIEVKNGEVTTKLIPLPESVAKSSNEVLDRERLLAEKEGKEKLLKFIERVSSKEIESNLNLYDSLEAIAKEENLSDEIVAGIKKRLEQAELELDKEEVEENE